MGTGVVPKPERVPKILPEHLEEGLLNLVVYGPGKGEACVVRLPDGRVGVVDGCREDKDPVAELLDALRATAADSAAFRLAFVAMTHPHDDHYAGLGRLLKRWRGKVDEVWFNGYGTRYAERLLAFVRNVRAAPLSLPDEKAVEGLGRFLEEARRATCGHDTAMQWLVADKCLARGERDGQPLEVWSCGPADLDMDDAALELTTALELLALGQPLGKPLDPNLSSGATLIRWGAAAVLLGGDLLCGHNSRRGWWRARERVGEAVQVVSVAHHASEEAHDEVLWDQMRPALAIVTPFKNAGGSQPPRPEMVKKLAGSAVVVMTSPPAWTWDDQKPVASHGLSCDHVPPGPVVRGRNNAVKQLALAGTPARHNAVAVALDASGAIRRLVLAGDAGIWSLLGA
jgi:beta-lactamase superfamily II metal-dependent hydrolase